jgi:membrane-associated phospholipid phosphatase
MRLLVISILVFVCATDLLGVTQDSVYSTVQTLSSDGKTFLSNTAAVITSPFHFSSADWMSAGTVVLSTAILLNADIPVRNAFRHQHSLFNDRLAHIGNAYGEGLFGFGLATTLYAGGVIGGHDKLRETGIILLESLTIATTISTAGKCIISRSRPIAEEGATRFNGFKTDYLHTSFPSGHATVAFAVSSVLAEQFDVPLLTIGLYSLSTLTALSRVYDDQHWLSDTFAGAVLGTVCGISVSHLHKSKEHSMSVYIVPMFNGVRSEIRF